MPKIFADHFSIKICENLRHLREQKYLTMNILSNKNLEHLLAEKPFEALSFEEQNLVLESMDEEEYQRMHRLIRQSKKALKNNPSPDPAIRENLLTALRRQKQQPQEASVLSGSLLVKMLNYRLPVWQAAAAVAALFGFFFWAGHTPLTGVRTEKVYVYVTDTIYKEVSLPGMDTAANVPSGRLNVKPAYNIDSSLNTLETMADSSARFVGRSDSLSGYPHETDDARKKPDDRVRNLWLFWETLN